MSSPSGGWARPRSRPATPTASPARLVLAAGRRRGDGDLPLAGGGRPEQTVYTGDYEARISPTADNDPETGTPRRCGSSPAPTGSSRRRRGPGRSGSPGRSARRGRAVVDVPSRRNLASGHNGAQAAGDGINLDALIDDTESTNWASLASEGTASEGLGEGKQVQGRQVTVDLGGTPGRDQPGQRQRRAASGGRRGRGLGFAEPLLGLALASTSWCATHRRRRSCDSDRPSSTSPTAARPPPSPACARGRRRRT